MRALVLLATCASIGFAVAALAAPPRPGIGLDWRIGAVHYDEPKSQVDAALGRRVWKRMGRRDGWKDFYPRARLYVDYYTYRGRQYALSIITDSPRFKTASGIGVGSSVTQLRRRIDVTCDLVDSYTCQHEPAGTGQALTLFDIDRTTRRVVRISIVGN